MSREMIWVEHVARMLEMRNAHRIPVEKTEKKRPLGQPRRRWEDHIGIDLKRKRLEKCVLDSAGSGENQLLPVVNTVMKLGIP
jgi:hypothetical protein